MCYYISRLFVIKAAPIIATTETTESAAAEPHPPHPLSTTSRLGTDSLTLASVSGSSVSSASVSGSSVSGASVSGSSVSGASVSGSGAYFTSIASASVLSFETSILLSCSTVVASSKLFIIASCAAEYLE